MDKIKLIKEALEKADKFESKLSNDVLAIGGFTSDKIRHLLNNLGTLSTNVFEIGSHRGSTFCSTIYGNENIKNATCCDNFTEFDDGTVRQALISNTENFKPKKCNLTFIEKDCFTITKEKIPELIDLYIFDGAHDYESQRKAFTHFKDFLADQCIIIVDDFNWDVVKEGTQEGINQCGFKLEFQKHLGFGMESDSNGWWNGLLVGMIKK